MALSHTTSHTPIDSSSILSNDDHSCCVSNTDSNPISPEFSAADSTALKKLSENLESLLDSPDFDFCRDATFVVSGGREVSVHCCILLARSPFLWQVFTGNSAGKFELKELAKDLEAGYDAFMAVLSYLYSGRVKPLLPGVWICIDEEYPHLACRPAVDFLVEVLYVSFIFQIGEMVILYQVGEIICRFEKKGFSLKGLKLMSVEHPFAEKHYEDLSAKPFFNGLVEYIISGPVFSMVWEGKNVVKTSRKIQAQFVSAVRTRLNLFQLYEHSIGSGLNDWKFQILTSSITSGDRVALQRLFSLISRSLNDFKDMYYPSFAEWVVCKIKIRLLAAHASVKCYAYTYLRR